MAHPVRPHPQHADVPVSTGIPPVVLIALGAGLFAILGILALTAYSSGIGHVWPWTEATKVKL